MTERARLNIISVVIIVVLGMQLAATALRLSRWGWPFTDYPMYSVPRYEGDRISAHHFVYATTRDGQEVEITPTNMGLNVWLFRKWADHLVGEAKRSAADKSLTPAARHGSSGSIKAWLKSTSLYKALNSSGDDITTIQSSVYLDLAERKLGIDIVQLRIEDLSYVVTRNGMKPAPRETVLIDVESD